MRAAESVDLTILNSQQVECTNFFALAVGRCRNINQVARTQKASTFRLRRRGRIANNHRETLSAPEFLRASSKTQMRAQMTNKANRSLIKRNVENLIATILSGGVKKFECVTEIFTGKVAERTKGGDHFLLARG